MLPDRHWWMEGRARVLEKIMENHSLRGGVALDAGAGNGFWGQRISPRFDTLVLLEPDPQLGMHIKERQPSLNVVSAALPGTLPFDEATFNFIFCLDVIEHVDDDYKSVRELRRILGPKGVLLLSAPAHPRLWSQMDLKVGHKRRYTRAGLESLLKAAEFELLLLEPLNVWLYPVAWLMRKMNRTGGSLPPRPLNSALARIFASEARFVGAWPSYMRGLSWVCLAQSPDRDRAPASQSNPV